MRVATIQDLPTLIELVNATRPTSTLFSGPGSEALLKQIQWMLGVRGADYIGSPMYATAAPFFLLEKSLSDSTTQTVAAAGAQSAPSTFLSIHPLLWNGKESAIDVVTAMVQHLVKVLAEWNGDDNK
jgi:hypothetical protein